MCALMGTLVGPPVGMVNRLRNIYAAPLLSSPSGGRSSTSFLQELDPRADVVPVIVVRSAAY